MGLLCLCGTTRLWSSANQSGERTADLLLCGYGWNEWIYDPFKEKQGAIYYEMNTENESERYLFNPNYDDEIPLSIIEAGKICQLPWLNENVNYHSVMQNLEKLEFITDTDKFPEYANL